MNSLSDDLATKLLENQRFFVKNKKKKNEKPEMRGYAISRRRDIMTQRVQRNEEKAQLRRLEFPATSRSEQECRSIRHLTMLPSAETERGGIQT